MKRSYNIKRTSFVCVALLLVALPGVAEKKREARGISQCCLAETEKQLENI